MCSNKKNGLNSEREETALSNKNTSSLAKHFQQVKTVFNSYDLPHHIKPIIKDTITFIPERNLFSKRVKRLIYRPTKHIGIEKPEGRAKGINHPKRTVKAVHALLMHETAKRCNTRALNRA